MGQDRREAEKADLNSAYDLIRGLLSTIVDVHERAMLIRNLEVLHDAAWRTVAPTASENPSSPTSKTATYGSASGAENTTESGETYDKQA